MYNQSTTRRVTQPVTKTRGVPVNSRTVTADVMYTTKRLPASQRGLQTSKADLWEGIKEPFPLIMLPDPSFITCRISPNCGKFHLSYITFTLNCNPSGSRADVCREQLITHRKADWNYRSKVKRSERYRRDISLSNSGYFCSGQFRYLISHFLCVLF
jgi:hypothetical protein